MDDQGDELYYKMFVSITFIARQSTVNVKVLVYCTICSLIKLISKEIVYGKIKIVHAFSIDAINIQFDTIINAITIFRF